MRRHMQIVFQDPYASLNPRMKVSAIVEEPLKVHDMGTAKIIERKQPMNCCTLSDCVPKMRHILNLMKELQEQFRLTYVFISHNLSVVRHVSDGVVVIYLGRLVEFSDKTGLYLHLLHPYTQALLSAVPRMDHRSKKSRIILHGDIPSPDNPPSSCTFHTRCRQCMPVCKEIRLELKTVADRHQVACQLY